MPVSSIRSTVPFVSGEVPLVRHLITSVTGLVTLGRLVVAALGDVVSPVLGQVTLTSELVALFRGLVPRLAGVVACRRPLLVAGYRVSVLPAYGHLPPFLDEASSRESTR